jgi:hypothetical protein
MLCEYVRDCLNNFYILARSTSRSDPFGIAFDCVERAAPASIQRRRFHRKSCRSQSHPEKGA